MSTADITFPTLLQDFFQRRLVSERGVSAHTIASYRDSFGLLLRYAETRTGRAASTLTVQDLDAPMILSFLDHLESERKCGARTRNLRLTAIRSFMRYVSIRDPASLPVAQRVLAIAGKRFDRPVLEFLSRDEIQALLDAPDRDTWSGHRDAALFAVLYNTVHLHGKGRKERVIPLWKSTATQLRSWLQCIDHQPKAPVFPNRAGNALSRSGVEHRLRVTIGKASLNCPSLQGRTISPHTLRHTTALHLLQSGVDITVIAMWLGHEDIATTHQYIEADLEMKEAVLKRMDAPSSKPVRFKAKDRLLDFLEGL
ncbi:MAG: integrase [Gammaproteobacteria bacterium SG8_47]|nr:MAG: integrase [Gammaproteobacteria bacterium SG8_47]